MDLSRGICILCTNNTKVIVPPQAEDTTSLIKDILADQIDCEKFDEINSSLKICPVCLYDVLTVADLKQNIKEGFSETFDSCTLCYGEKQLIYITEWAYFDRILENVKTEKRLAKCSTCMDCIKCLDLLDKIKTNLLKKYPKLALSDFVKKKNGIERASKALSMAKSNRSLPRKAQRAGNSLFETSSDEESNCSPQNSRKNVNNLKDALRHLTPLKDTEFKIDAFKRDKKLIKQVAFVKLSASNLSITDCKTLDETWKSSKSDTDSSGDLPSPKQSFFKIRLKINPNKMKSRKVISGKVSKPKAHKDKSISGNKKELIVKILKMDFDKMRDFNNEVENTKEIKTPTKASRKMLPEDSLSSNKKRKSVTFADILDTEITDGLTHKDHTDATPLKSLLKKSVSPNCDSSKNGDESTSDESDTEKKKNVTRGRSKPDRESDEEGNAPKGYVEEIQKHNDDIFDSLKSFDNAKETPVKATEHKKRNSVGNSSSDSEDGEKGTLEGKNTKSNKYSESVEVRSSRSKSKEVNSSDSENNDEEKSSGNEETVNKSCEEEDNGVSSANVTESKRKKSLKINSSDDSEDNEEDASSGNEETVNKNCEEEDNGVSSANVTKSKRKTRLKINSSDSEDNQEDKKRTNLKINSSDSEDNQEVKKRTSLKINSSDSEDNRRDVEDIADENSVAHINTSKDNGEVINSDDFDITKGNKTRDEKSKFQKDSGNCKERKDEKKEDSSKNSKKSQMSERKAIDHKHKKRKRLISNSDSDVEENTQKEDTDGKGFIKNKEKEDQETEISSTEKSDAENSSTKEKCFGETKSVNEDILSISSEPSKSDTIVTLQEGKKPRISDLDKDDMSEEDAEENSNPIKDSGSETFSDNAKATSDNVVDEDSGQVSEDEAENNVDIPDDETVKSNEDNQSKDKERSDIESDSEKSNSSFDSGNLTTKLRKRRRSYLERTEEKEENSSRSREDEDLEEPETKKEKVSEIDDLNNTELEKHMNVCESISEGKALAVTKEPKNVGPVDTKIDELIAKYTNPSIPNLSNDNNVSDSRNAEASGSDQGSESEESARGCEETVDTDADLEEEILEKGDETNTEENVKSLVKNNSGGDITINSDPVDKNNVTFRDLDLDNALVDVEDGDCQKFESSSESFVTARERNSDSLLDSPVK